MSDTVEFQLVEFADNPEPRCACVLLLDTSGSMDGPPIAELNDGLQTLQSSLMVDSVASLRVELSIITFGGSVMSRQEFANPDHVDLPILSASGNTPMGQALNLALDRLEERKRIYKAHGIAYYQPWLFLITDGAPTDGAHLWRQARNRIAELESRKALSIFPIGVEAADMRKLAELSTKREPLRLRGLNFQDMFIWLSQSLSQVSRSNPTDEVPLQSPRGWGAV